MTNYETDSRPFPEVLKDFATAVNGGKSYGARLVAAEKLRISERTIAGWLAGRPCAHEAAFRLLMTLTQS